MKTHTTNYTNTFIIVADDSLATAGEAPPAKAEKTVANIQYEMISQHPYQYTSDDVVFGCYAAKNGIKKGEEAEARTAFFSKGQACLRCSPLAKRYGFGIHSNAEGKVALYGIDTNEYQKFIKDKNIAIVKAMRSKKA